MHPLKLGLFLPTFEWTAESPFAGLFSRTPRWPDLLAVARRAEAVGFDSLWLPDHLLFRWEGDTGASQGQWEAWSVLAALAATTERIELGTLVLCAAFRNPALLAKMADTVDEISGGRLVLGLGAGWHEPEYRAFGFPYDHRFGRFEEAFTIVRTLLREGRIDFAGTYHEARECELRPRGPRSQGPPILVGGSTPPKPRLLRLAVEHADLWNDWLVFGRSHPDAVPPLREAVDAACVQAGRDPATLGRTVSVMVAAPGHEPAPTGPGVEPVVGDAAAVVEALRGFAELGAAHLQVVLNPSTEAALEAMAPVVAALKQDGPRPR
jgi:probable F420-dependent oxidoreductase